ncbi:response regulator [Pseudanabaena sp. PCC 6802]|uniref:response regulator n=1 Tax=Pseudanabaena sp. PCC 6802 TaxID=118173 RepID=UPI0003481370|nr:response regulator [Pseudanabaena sp. PCC 6802]
MKFLVVDDSAVDRHLLTSILEGLGHQVDACESAVGTLERILSGNYQAVFLDIVMPEQDGYKFLRELRSNDRTAKQHVIICSSKKTPVEVNYGVNRAGANDYITKPATAESVSQALQKVA